MTDTSIRIFVAGGPRAIATRALLSLAVLASVDVAQAAELQFPKARPEVVLAVPDDWTIDTTALGLDLRSPEKNSIIVAQVIGREKSLVEAWSRKAGEKMKAFGVVFDSMAKEHPPSAPPPSTSLLKPDTTPNTPSAFTTSPDGFTFSGAPSLATPGSQGSNDPLKVAPTFLQQPKDPADKSEAKLSFRAVEYVGTTVKGKPVDTELVIYTLSNKRLFVMMQESEPDDNRSVAIGKSVRSAR